ncbi:baseplate wedge [Synechococcus phage S-PM2]|uniref:Baseplate wedge n=1 Tax=Synechococcus phage S-PM2 TaxID=238854 RepID=Q5GQX0_BPSYP|nr:baseplate wedge subunit [Synechococcus phage S-PM2]CAF34147.1 baseplate wedge [Synechococcus phage S-PM2]CFW42214.1 baseplate wedge [Synechococcus phage S-PM2]
MAAIISDKFRIFNAKQFLESLSEGTVAGSGGDPELGNERTRMYFFVGRPQGWDSFLELYSQNSTPFVASQFVYVSSDGNGSYTYANSPFKASIVAAYENSLVLSSIQPSVNSSPLPGATIKGWNGASDTGAEAKSGVYRFATEDIPPVPLDNQREKFDVYDDIIAAKRITSQFVRPVVTRYDWNLVATEKRFDMFKPDYSATVAGRVGKSSTTGASALGDAKYYVVNANYEVFKCLYNGEFPGQVDPDPVYEPKTNPSGGEGTYNPSTGIFTERATAIVAASGASGYVWKYMYTIPTEDVLRFLSTNFMSINLAGEPTRAGTESIAVDGAIDIVLIEDRGTGLPNGTHYAPVVGDGQLGGNNPAIVKIVVSGGQIESTEVVDRGTGGYTYASVPLENGQTIAGLPYGLYSNQTLTTPRTGVTGTGALEVVLPPQGGHGSDFELELNAKRVMTNIRLTYAEGQGDFPVDNDFRRIGILKDPELWNSSDYATLSTLNGMYAVKIQNATAGFVADEEITQNLAGGGVAKGNVVSWTLDTGSTTNGVLKYVQSPEFHANGGIVRAFDNSANIVGSNSLASGSVDPSANATTILGIPFTSGFGYPEIKPNSGDIIYVENRRLITRAADQIEDIKLVIEF